ncbi:SH3 domain-containing protein [Aquimarina sp. 2201CG14-23]|uniref:SH3 domain-containing protein n=1 Tax=Aquimarina mycalae TaxID=3040073 RepID=UPI0024782C1B|nr:SH3 domain-containing protein [Aquimarina sp. 2201CG14-23]MDH7447574.1 SH3 domain-containing protein [Aquimarina sp. 2201CG14-23]
MKKAIILLLVFQFQSVISQKTFEQIIDEIPLYENHYSPFSYSDGAEKKQGFSIQNEAQVLKRLKLTPLKNREYYITGKYEINNLIVLFFSEYSVSENIHFAILFDKSLNIIDRLKETAYDNEEGFYGVNSWIDYNILTVNIHNIYNNPEYIRKKYSITNRGFIAINNQVIIKTPSGIRIRNKPTTNSAIVATAPNLKVFDYLSSNYEVDSTSVFDNGKYLKNQWLKVATKDSIQQLGYVFGAFAKRHIEVMTNDYKVILDEISEEEFYHQKDKNKSTPSVKKITDIKKIKNILKNQLIGEYDEDNSFTIEKILTDNGKEFSGLYEEECNIIAYYPQYHYLLLECGHSSDYLINLKNGEDDINRIGNPDYYFSSPQNTFRLNGYYSGQSNVYFLEKNNKNAAPEYMFSISSLIQSDYLEKYFWKNNNTILVKVEKMYYKIQLQKL